MHIIFGTGIAHKNHQSKTLRRSWHKLSSLEEHSQNSHFIYVCIICVNCLSLFCEHGLQGKCRLVKDRCSRYKIICGMVFTCGLVQLLLEWFYLWNLLICEMGLLVNCCNICWNGFTCEIYLFVEWVHLCIVAAIFCRMCLLLNLLNSFVEWVYLWIVQIFDRVIFLLNYKTCFVEWVYCELFQLLVECFFSNFWWVKL